MSRYSSDISNMSYTNKDFGTIYPELLELAQKLSYKWDPTTSDESDPGVVLLKLAAIVADKNNYNIDKNILETFPTSVTQFDTARQLFNQLGYSMRHYYSAETTISMVINEEPELDAAVLGIDESNLENATWLKENKRSYDIPRFTMISDNLDEIVYTIKEPVTLSSDKKVVSVGAIQGIIQDYSVNNSTTILASAIDYNNRLYFNDTNVAENGIFITNSGKESWYEWFAVDNLSIQPLGTMCYKFGISVGDGRCYIEFPSDIDNLIGEGLNIKYVLTNGRSGNIGKNRLKKFFNDTKAYAYMTNYGSSHTAVNAIDIPQENVTIYNANSSDSGRDPETIEDAYSNYEKVKTTFDTLVSLRDYENYLTRQDFHRPFASNGIVLDRTNDIQASYKVVDSEGEVSVNIDTKRMPCPYPTYDSSGQPLSGTMMDAPMMDAFDLRLYALHYNDAVDTTDGFVNSFELQFEDANDVYGIGGYHSEIQKIKSIQHDFLKFEPGKIIILKNKYPIVAKIVPIYKVDSQQMIDIVANIRVALLLKLNASKVKFGSVPDYNEIYDTILAADNRIKALILEELDYETFAIYTIDNKEAIEIRIDDGSERPVEDTSGKYVVDGNDYQPHKMWKEFRNEIYAKSVLCGVTQLYPDKNKFVYSINQEAVDVLENVHRIDTGVTIGMAGSVPDEGNGSPYYSSSVTIADNESILLSMPSLIKDKDYASYVKYLVHTSESDILADTEYELSGDDFIIFFWKNSDTDTFYTYQKYTSESDAKYLCPTFNMKGMNPDPSAKKLAPIPWTMLSNLPEGSGTTAFSGSVPAFGEVSEMLLSEYIRQLAGDDYVLSGDSTITPKKPNTVHINNSTNGTEFVAWFLNSSREGYDTVLFDVGETRYTLQDGESFIYWNKSKSHIVSLGAGTVIERSSSTMDPSVLKNTVWKCAYFDYGKFVNDPLNYLDDIVFVIPQGADVFAHEMMFYQIGPKNTLTFKWVDDHVRGIDLNKDADSRVCIDEDGVFVMNGNTRVEFPLSNVEISYTDEDGSSQLLPTRISVDNNWTAMTIYNLDCSPSHEQSILNNPPASSAANTTRNQWIKFYDDSGTLLNPTCQTDVKIRSSNVSTVVGGKGVDVTFWNIVTGKTVPISIYMYRDAPLPDLVTVDDSSKVVSFTIPASEEGTQGVVARTINYKVPAGKYVLSIKQTAGQPVVVSMTGGSIDDIRAAKAGAEYAYYLIESDGRELGLNLTCVQDDSSAISILIPPLYRTEQRTQSDKQNYLPLGIDLDDVVTIINDLDMENNFSFTYIVPSDVSIDNPIDSDSFMDSNHPFNRVSICEWDVANEDTNKIDVTNKIK